ncbi:MAG: hypothetical protein JWL80_668 [Parcubacteria group bacterium]|nr:hypothetical protein [Parcubacteria group bacterium]
MNTRDALTAAKADIERLREAVKAKHAGQFAPLVNPLQDMENRFRSLKEFVFFRLSLRDIIEIPSNDELEVEERGMFRQFKSCVEQADIDFPAQAA